MTNFRSYCTDVLSRVRKNSTFMTIHHYTNNNGQVADYSVCFHIDYIRAIRTSLNLLEKFHPNKTHIQKVGSTELFTLNDLLLAREELLASFQMSLRGDNPLATSAHAYEHVLSESQEIVPGVKLHTEQDLLHVWGFCVHYRVILPGAEKEDRRWSKTIAKDMLRSMLPIGKFVQFKLAPGRFERLVVQNMTVTDEDVIRNAASSIQFKGLISA